MTQQRSIHRRPARARLDDLLSRRARFDHRRRLVRAAHLEDTREVISLIRRVA